MILSALFALLVQDLQTNPFAQQDPVAAVETPLLVQTYDVADLSGHGMILGLEGALLNQVGVASDTQKLREDFETLRLARTAAKDALADIRGIVCTHMEPAFRAEQNLLEILENGRILLLGTPEQHSWVDSYLLTCRLFNGLIQVETVIVSLPIGSLQVLGQERSGQVIAKEQAESLLAGAKGIPGVEVLDVPMVATSPFRKVNLTAVTQIAYIKDYELIVIDEKNEIADPMVGVVQEGVVLDLSATPLKKGRFTLDTHLTYSSLERPIRTLETTIGAGGHKVTVQLPEVTISRLKGEFEIGPDECLAIASTGPAGTQEVLMLMSVKH